MRCFICENSMRSHIMRDLNRRHRMTGWVIYCISCAIHHRLDGRLVRGRDDPDIMRWRAFQRVLRAES